MEVENGNNVGTDQVDDGLDSTESQKPEKITYSEAQQKHLEILLKDAQRRTAKELRSKLELAELRLREVESRPAGYNPEVERLQSELEQAHKSTASLAREAVIAREATRLGYFDSTVLSKLVSSNLEYDRTTKTFTVLDDNGEPKLNSSTMEPMSVSDFLADYGNRNPFLLRGQVKGGIGSAQSQKFNLGAPKIPLERIFGDKSDGRIANEIAKRDKKEYARLKAQARAEGLIKW